MSLARTSGLFFCALVFLLAGVIDGAEMDRGLERSWPMIASQDQVWVGTIGGLYRYDISEDAWLVFTPREGLCDWSAGLLGLDQDILWVGTGHGLCNADIRLFDWEVFDTTRGLPGNEILALAFEEDYAWIGTDAGVVRYDPLIEELESFSGERTPAGLRVNDIAVEGETVWLATEEGVWEFSTEYETWRVHSEMQGLPSRQVERIIAGGGGLWFITDAGPARFDVPSRTWFSYQIPGASRINDVALDGSSIWLATDSGVFFYDTTLDQWREFQELKSLEVQEISSIVLAQGQIWLTAEIGVARFDQATKTWTRYTVENGLSSDQVKTVNFWGEILFATSREAIDYYKIAEDRWYSRPVRGPDFTEDAEGGSSFSLGGPEGAIFRPTHAVTMRLLGRASWQYQRTDELDLDEDETTATSEVQSRTNLVLASSLGGGRTANAFYDDTKFDREEEYGLRYHGAEKDLLQEISLGDMRWNLGRGELLPTLGLFGTGARIETGPRTARLRRRRLAIDAVGGDQTTDFQSDYFVGSSRQHSGLVQDRNYLARRFFPIAGGISEATIEPSSVRIYLDDGIEANNTLNTLEDMSVAGMQGDFDLLRPVEDYILAEQGRLLNVRRALSDFAVLAVVYRDRHDGNQERILFGPGADMSLVNRYSLGAMGILPQTLHLAIIDSLDVAQSLSAFGLDQSGDGAVDAELVDFHNGVLTFRDQRPFPESVYLPDDPKHLFTIRYSYQTSSATLQLSRQDLISESEKVVVDGQVLRRGEDYILDYRSGSLLFLREGLIESSSRVEVEYEYWRVSEDRLLSLGASFSPSDVLSTSVSAVRYYPQRGDSTLSRVDQLQASGELRLEDGPAGMDLWFISEAARSDFAQEQGTAARVRASAKSDRVRLLAEMEDYGRQFHSLRSRQTVMGQLDRRARLEAQYERPNLFVLEGDWTTERSLTDEGHEATEERYGVRSIVNRSGYPSVVMVFARRLGRGASSFPNKTSLRGDVEYQVPAQWSSALKLHSLKLTSYLRRSWEEGIDTTFSPSSHRAIGQSEYIRLDVAPKPAFQMVASLRREWRRIQLSGQNGSYQPAGETGEAIFSTNCDQISGISLYARLEGNAREDYLFGGLVGRAYDLDRQRQVTARIYPGRWRRLFNPLTLEMDYVYRWNGQLSGLARSLEFLDRYWSAYSGSELVAAERYQSRQVRAEIRPSSQIVLNLGLERQGQDFQEEASLLETRVWKYSGKVELRRAGSVLVVSFVRDDQDDGGISNRVKDAPSFWWEHRWSRGLITKLSFFLWREKLQEGLIKESSAAVSPRLGITSRWPEMGVLGAVEVVDDLSLTLSQWDGPDRETSTRVLANSLKLDMRPLPMALLRFQSQISYTAKKDLSDFLHHDLSLKLTLQF